MGVDEVGCCKAFNKLCFAAAGLQLTSDALVFQVGFGAGQVYISGPGIKKTRWAASVCRGTDSSDALGELVDWWSDS